jgi:BNR/Asp-box repeat
MFVNKVGLLAVTFLAGSCAALGLAAPPTLAASSGVGPVTDVSSACAGQNAEVEQAGAPPHYVYEAWIGCGGEGFARSADGGKTFGQPLTLPDSGGSDDPAIAVAPDGTVYVSYLRYHDNHAYPVVATSFDHGATFTQVSSIIPHRVGNWGDRDFIAAGRGGTVYVTWDYGPSAADVKIVCSPSGSCAYSAVDATAVVQKSTNHGKTWGPITPMQPGFPAGGGYDASIVVQPNGEVDALMIDHPLNPRTFKVHPGHELFTRSADGGKTWSRAVEVGGSADTLSDTEWWIDGDLSTDRAGHLYATWDTQTSAGDIRWLSYSTDGGRTWSAPTRVTPDHDNAVHIVQSAAAGPGIVDIAWLADNSPRGLRHVLAALLHQAGVAGAGHAGVQPVRQSGDLAGGHVRHLGAEALERPQRAGTRRPELGRRRQRQQELGDLRHGSGPVTPGP